MAAEITPSAYDSAPMRRLAALMGTLWLAAACASASPAFALTGASVDPTYRCPGGATDSPYDLHALIDVRNDTSSPVKIKSVTAEMRLAEVNGSWLERVGDRYDAGSVKFDPSSVGAGARTKINVTIPSSCTSGAYGSAPSNWGKYRVTMRLTTSSGGYSISASNEHQILTA